MELLHGPADPAPILNHAAAEERLLARYDRPARALLLEPWEAELLARLVQAWRAHQSPPVKDAAAANDVGLLCPAST